MHVFPNPVAAVRRASQDCHDRCCSARPFARKPRWCAGTDRLAGDGEFFYDVARSFAPLFDGVRIVSFEWVRNIWMCDGKSAVMDVDCELVASAGDGADKIREPGLGLEGFSKAEDLLGEVCLFDEGVSPDCFEEFFLGNEASGIAYEVEQDFEGLGREGDFFFVTIERMARRTETKSTEAIGFLG